MATPAYHGDAETLRRHPSFQKMRPEQQEKKIGVVQESSALMKKYPLMPTERPTQDAAWGIAFGLSLLGLLYLVFIAVTKDTTTDDAPYRSAKAMMLSAVGSEEPIDALDLGKAFAGAAVSAGAAALGFLYLAHQFTKQTIYACAVGVGTIFIRLGIASLMGKQYLSGACMLFAGIIYIAGIFTCWQKYIPFTVQLLTTIAKVISDNPRMYLVAMVGSFLSILWVCLCVFALTGAMAFASSRWVLFVYFFMVIWGTMVCSTIPHTTYCGAFARWYFEDTESGDRGAGGMARPLVTPSSEYMSGIIGPSLRVACSSSFGSICCGTALVAFVRAIAAMARDEEQKSDNAVACVCLLIVQCVAGCLGDFLEYLNDWAYVQCAIRGCGYFDAAKITYSLCTCANVKYILADCLLGTVSAGGTVLVMFCGSAGGGLIGYAIGASTLAQYGCILGFITGAIAASGTVGIIRSASKAILVCWAENPEPLKKKHGDLADAFHSKVGARLTSS